MHVDGDLAAVSISADVVGERQRSLPGARRLRPTEALEDGRGIFVREWVDRNTGLVALELRNRDALGVRQIRCGGDPRGLRVAGIDRQELHRAALHSGLRTVGALRIDIAAEVAVVGGVGIDEHAFGSEPLREINLYPAEVPAVPDEDNLV